MANTNLKADFRRATKDGTYPVKISVGYGTGMYLSTGIHVLPEEWDECSTMCIGKQARQKNAALQAIIARVRTRLFELLERGMLYRLNNSQLREMLENLELESPANKSVGFVELFERVAESKKKKNTTSTFESYMQALSSLHRFRDLKHLQFEDVTTNWLREYVLFLQSDGVCANTQRTYLCKLRHVINIAYDEELIKTDPFRRFRFPRAEETRKRALPIESFKRLFAADGRKTDKTARDLFLLSFCLIGINPRDLYNIKPADIVGGRLQYKRAKTGRLYSIRVEPEAADLLPVLFELQKKRSFRTMVQHGEYLKRLHDEAGIIESDLTWYWARHSWATYAAELDIPEDTISRALGHSRGTGAAVTATYIKANNAKVDEANRRVIDFAFYGRR